MGCRAHFFSSVWILNNEDAFVHYLLRFESHTLNAKYRSRQLETMSNLIKENKTLALRGSLNTYIN